MTRPPLPVQDQPGPWANQLNTHVLYLGDEIDALDGRIDSLEAGGGVGSSRLVPLFIFHGESNSGGYADNTVGPTPTELAPRAGLQMFHVVALDHFEPLDVGTNNNMDHAGLTPATHGWEIGLANSFEAGEWWSPVGYLVQTGQGASRVDQWDTGGAYWLKFLSRTRNARSILRAQGLVPVIYVWQTLGINDALAGYPEATWKTKMADINTRIRAELGPVPIVSPLFMPTHGPSAAYNDSLQALAAEDGNMALVDSTGDTLRGDGYHWDYGGMKSLAEKMGALSRDYGQLEAHPIRQIAVAAGAPWLASGSVSTGKPTIVRSPSTLSFTEGSAGQGFTVSLSKAPTTSVTVAVAASGGNVQVDKPSLSFTTGNWNTPQTVTATSANDGTASGNRSSTITLSSPDVQASVTVSVTVVDAGGGGGSAPVNTALPVITGTAAVGQTLTCSSGLWSNSPTSYAYQWTLDGVNIAGATANTHIVAAGSGGKFVGCKVTATNATGSATATASGVPVAAEMSGPQPGTYVGIPFANLSANTTATPDGTITNNSGTVNEGGRFGPISTTDLNIVVEVESAALSNGVATLVEPDNSIPSYVWGSQANMGSIYQYANALYSTTSGTDATSVGDTMTFPGRYALVRSGDDLLSLYSKDNGVTWKLGRKFAGYLAGKSEVWMKTAFAVAGPAGLRARVTYRTGALVRGDEFNDAQWEAWEAYSGQETPP